MLPHDGTWLWVERLQAYRGIAPAARRCSSLYDLADWFSTFGIAAGAVKRSVVLS